MANCLDSPFNSNGGPSTPMASVGSNSSTLKIINRVCFTAEIQQMMFGLGDCRRPLHESAVVIEQIVFQQLKTLIYKAENVAKQRNSRVISLEDFLFLLRKDKVKLRRLIKYLELKDIKSSTQSNKIPDEFETHGVDGNPPLKKRKRLCFEFLKTIDQTGELLRPFDDTLGDAVKQSRALRAELQTRGMSEQEYKEYTLARQSSFTPRFKIQKFRDWLFSGMHLEVKPNMLALEVLNYMAFETVAQIVDISLIVKCDTEAKVEDPFSRVIEPRSHHLEVGGKTGSLFNSQQSSSQNSSLFNPESSSPNIDSSPSPSTPTSNSLGGLSTARSKSSAKKAAWSVTQGLQTYNAITPTEIHEAMRRFGSNIGPFADYAKYPMIPMKEQLLCT